ncbi:MAG: phosphotransferase [Gammaproteobacteria bacterium]|nr:phosphotransferase [Gammaproteobacteria bacterium]MYK82514.1 phosphotransferase [Gammaproteobacteria bacterium]
MPQAVEFMPPSKAPVLSSPDQVTPADLTAILNQAGLTGTVESVSWQRIGAGQVGQNARFTLSADGTLPKTLVGKFPATDPTSRQTGVLLRNYEREVLFYSTLAATVDIRTPAILAIQFDPDTHEFMLLMEDLAPGFQIDQRSECNTDQAALALEELAKLQGPRWGDAALAQQELLVRPPTNPGETPIYNTTQQGFTERYADRLSAAELNAVTHFGEAQAAYGSYAGPQTLIHIDYRLDNMIFGEASDSPPRPLTVFDWQSIGLGCALNDASYFMGTSLAPEHRAQEERGLLKHYLDVLRSYGVDLSWDACWKLYRRHAPAGLHMAVVASMIVGETERGNDMFMTMAKRSIAMCEDLESLDLLGG